MKKILVVFYSKTGSTQEVAEYLAKTLASETLEVTVKAVDQNPDLKTYDAVILGAPINGFNWVPEMTQYIQANQAVLSAMPTAAFCLTYVWGAGNGFFKQMIKGNFEKNIRPVHPEVNALFGGKIPSPMPGFVRFMFGIPKAAALDTRDWKTIDNWGQTLKAQWS